MREGWVREENCGKKKGQTDLGKRNSVLDVLRNGLHGVGLERAHVKDALELRRLGHLHPRALRVPEALRRTLVQRRLPLLHSRRRLLQRVHQVVYHDPVHLALLVLLLLALPLAVLALLRALVNRLGARNACIKEVTVLRVKGKAEIRKKDTNCP